MNTFINGMGGNAETAWSYILLGAFAASMTHTGLAPFLAKKYPRFREGIFHQVLMLFWTNCMIPVFFT